MRIAIVSDIHGNGTAFDAVSEDLRQTAPDLILHGGDLADLRRDIEIRKGRMLRPRAGPETGAAE